MSNIVQSYDASNNAVYPVTHLRAVRDSSGTTLESMMQDVREMAVGYYECSTSGSTAAKTITIDSSVSLSTKILCKVKFVEKNKANNATMNINGTGAKALYYNGVRVAANNSWYPNEVVDLYYDGTNYQAKSCADTLEYNVSLHQTHEITEITTTTRTLVFNGDVVSTWESETPVSDSSVEGYTRSETNTGQDVDSTTIDGPNATYNSTTNKTNVVYVTTHTYTHVVNNYTFQEAVNAVPMSYRHGGLKLSFITNSNSSVQTSDNKYVQFRCMAQNFTTDVTQWQGVDDEPTAGSDNLVKSGGVSESIGGVTKGVVDKNLTIDDFSITNKYIDSNGVAQTNSLWISTPYIKIKENTEIEVNLADGNNVVFVAFYSSNSDGAFISSWYGNRESVQTYTVPSNAKYFRASTQPQYTSTYVSYKDEGFVSKDILSLKEGVGKLDIIDGVTIKQYGTEVFTNNYGYINDNGIVDSNSNWKYTDFLPILGGTQMTARLGDGNGYVAIAFYSDNNEMAFISSTQAANGNESLPPAVIDVPQNAVCFRAANRNAYTSAFIISFLSSKQVALTEYNFNEIEKLKQRVSDVEEDVAVSDIPDFHIAKKVYCVKNDTNLLFVRGIVHSVNPYLCSRKCVSVDIPASNVRLFPRYLRILFSSVVTKNINFNLVDKKYNESEVKQSQIIVKEPQTPSSNINVVCLGSSTTDDGVWAGELKRRLVGSGGTPAGDNLSNIAFVGRMHGSENMDVQVEATGGWNWNSFINGDYAIELTVSGISNISNGDTYFYTNESGSSQAILYIQENNLSNGNGKIIVKPLSGKPISQSGTLTKRTGYGDSTISFSAYEEVTWSPFVQNGVFGFTNYANRYCNGSIDVMICHLSYLNMNKGGVNSMDTVMQKVKTFVDKLHTDFPNCKVIITTCIGASPNGGASEYGTMASSDPEKVYTDYGLLYGGFKFQDAVEEFIADDNYKDFCFMANTLEEVDMENAFPTGEIPLNLRTSGKELIQTNALHPTENGSLMTADSVYRCFVCTVLN